MTVYLMFWVFLGLIGGLIALHALAVAPAGGSITFMRLSALPPA